MNINTQKEGKTQNPEIQENRHFKGYNLDALEIGLR